MFSAVSTGDSRRQAVRFQAVQHAANQGDHLAVPDRQDTEHLDGTATVNSDAA